MYNRGAVTLILVISFVLVLPIGWLLLARYRKVIEQLMRGTTYSSPSDRGVRRSPSVSLKLRRQRAESHGHSIRLPSGPLAGAAFVELAGGLAFGLVAALLVLLFAGFEILPLRVIAVTVSFAWPSILVLNLMWGPDRPRQVGTVAAFGAVIVLLCLVSGLSSSEGGPMAFLAPIMLWAIYGSLGLLVLLFLNRSIRAIGPVLVVIAAAALFGANFALSLLTTDSGIAAAIDVAEMIGGGAWAALIGTASIGLGRWSRCRLDRRRRSGEPSRTQTLQRANARQRPYMAGPNLNTREFARDRSWRLGAAGRLDGVCRLQADCRVRVPSITRTRERSRRKAPSVLTGFWVRTAFQ